MIALGLRRCAPFSLPPRAIIEIEANRHSAPQMPFLHRTIPPESKLSSVWHGTKKSHNQRLRDLLLFRDSVGVKNLR